MLVEQKLYKLTYVLESKTWEGFSSKKVRYIVASSFKEAKIISKKVVAEVISNNLQNYNLGRIDLELYHDKVIGEIKNPNYLEVLE